MKKVLPFILILVILFSALAPISIHDGKISKQEALAVDMNQGFPSPENNIEITLSPNYPVLVDRVALSVHFQMGPNGKPGVDAHAYDPDGKVIAGSGPDGIVDGTTNNMQATNKSFQPDLGSWQAFYPPYIYADIFKITPLTIIPIADVDISGVGKSGIFLDLADKDDNAIPQWTGVGLAPLLQRVTNGKSGFTVIDPVLTVPIDGLTPNTEYHAKIRLEDDSSGDTGYSKSFTFTTAITNPEGVTTLETAGGLESGEGGNTGDDLPACGFVTREQSLYGCIIQVFYYAIWMPTSWIAGLAAKFLDYFIFYSIQSDSYNKTSFVVEGWKVIRDISNMAFIFVLLYVALKTILGMGGGDSKRTIIWVVVIALVINFSLFFTRVIVDSGNVLAGVLYTNITTDIKKDGKTIQIAEGTDGIKSVSSALVTQFDPQQIIQKSGLSFKSAESTEAALLLRTPFLIVIVMASIINVLMIYVFLSVAFLFVGRVIGLMVAMIFSPFAFVSFAIPGGGKLRDWSWDKWFPGLVSMSFMAPIFIFFLWLIIKFLDSKLLGGLAERLTYEGGIGFGSFIAVIVPFALLAKLLWKAKDLAEEFAGEVATSVNKLAQRTVGYTTGLSADAIGKVGRVFVGRYAGAAAAAGSTRGSGGTTPRSAFSSPTSPRPRGPITPPNPPPPGARTIIPGGPNGGGGGFTPPSFFSSPRSPVQPRPPVNPPPKIPPGALFSSGGVNARINLQGTSTPAEIEARERERAANQGIPTINTRQQTPEEIEAQRREGLARQGIITGGPILRTTPTMEQTNQTTGEPQSRRNPDTSNLNVPPPDQRETRQRRSNIETNIGGPTIINEAIPAGKSLKDMASEAPKSFLSWLKSGNKAEGVENYAGKQAFKLLNYLGKASFDIRNTKLMQLISKKTGLDFGKAGGEGGWEKMQEKIAENEEKFAKALKASGEELVKMNELENRYKDLILRQNQIGGKGKDANFDKIVEQAEKDFKKEKGRIDEINQMRNFAYAEQLENSGYSVTASKATKKSTANKIRGSIKSKNAPKDITDDMKELFKKMFEEQEKNKKP